MICVRYDIRYGVEYDRSKKKKKIFLRDRRVNFILCVRPLNSVHIGDTACFSCSGGGLIE